MDIIYIEGYFLFWQICLLDIVCIMVWHIKICMSMSQCNKFYHDAYYHPGCWILSIVLLWVFVLYDYWALASSYLQLDAITQVWNISWYPVINCPNYSLNTRISIFEVWQMRALLTETQHREGVKLPTHSPTQYTPIMGRLIFVLKNFTRILYSWA